MVLNNIDIYNLLPEELNELIEMIKEALKIVKNRKRTVSKIAANEKENIVCPHCHTSNIIKNGHTKNGLQSYKCKNKKCKKCFNDLTGTIFSGCHFTYEQLEIFFSTFYR